MKAMILAAGRGERMRPLTDSLPKPLLCVNDKPLLQYHIEALAAAGIRELVINHAIMGKLIEERFGDGKSLGVSITWSAEGDRPLDTGGGIVRALPLLGEAAFVVVNADIWTAFDFSRLPAELSADAHLVLVDNPRHHPEGDFQLQGGLVRADGDSCLTYSGIGVYTTKFFSTVVDEVFPLAPLLRRAMEKDRVSGEFYPGRWLDVGTPERLQDANKLARL